MTTDAKKAPGGAVTPRDAYASDWEKVRILATSVCQDGDPLPDTWEGFGAAYISKDEDECWLNLFARDWDRGAPNPLNTTLVVTPAALAAWAREIIATMERKGMLETRP